jgi:hypothetical protein
VLRAESRHAPVTIITPLFLAFHNFSLEHSPGRLEINLSLTMTGHDRAHGMVAIRRCGEQRRAAAETLAH